MDGQRSYLCFSRNRLGLEPTDLVSQDICHEPAAQPLTKAHDAIFGSRVDLKLEALSRLDILDELLALGCDVLLQGGLEFWVFDDRLGSNGVIVAHVLDEGLGLFQQLTLCRFYTDCCVDVPQPPVDLKKSSYQAWQVSNYRGLQHWSAQGHDSPARSSGNLLARASR